MLYIVAPFTQAIFILMLPFAMFFKFKNKNVHCERGLRLCAHKWIYKSVMHGKVTIYFSFPSMIFIDISSVTWHQFIVLKLCSLDLAESRLLESLPVAKSVNSPAARHRCAVTTAWEYVFNGRPKKSLAKDLLPVFQNELTTSLRDQVR